MSKANITLKKLHEQSEYNWKMFKVAVDVSPTKMGHKVRGIGAYTNKLTEEFKKSKWPANFVSFENSKPPLADIIHYPYFDLFFRTLPAKSHAPRVVTVHDVIPLIYPQFFPTGVHGRINFFFQKKALINTEAIICDSLTSKNDIYQKLSYPKEKIHVVYLAASENFKKIQEKINLEVVTKKFNLPKDFVLYVGDVNWNKNILTLLEAIKLSKVSLVMVGQALTDSNLEQTDEINRLVKKLNLQKQITKTGFVSENELVAIYNLAKLTILPSYYEGFGLPVLESMACGTPVICSDNSSLSEIAKGAAVFCDPENPKDISVKITNALNLNQKDRQSLSQKSIEHAALFSWHKTAAETIEVYKIALSR